MLKIETIEEKEVLIEWIKIAGKKETHYGGENYHTPAENSLLQKLGSTTSEIILSNDEFAIIRSCMFSAFRIKNSKAIFLLPNEQTLFEKINEIEAVPKGIDWSTALKNQGNSKNPISARENKKVDISALIQYSVAALSIIILVIYLLIFDK